MYGWAVRFFWGVFWGGIGGIGWFAEEVLLCLAFVVVVGGFSGAQGLRWVFSWDPAGGLGQKVVGPPFVGRRLGFFWGHKCWGFAITVARGVDVTEQTCGAMPGREMDPRKEVLDDT